MNILIVTGLFIAVVVLAKKLAFPSRQDGRVQDTTILERLSTLIKSPFIQVLIDVGALFGILLAVVGLASFDTRPEVAPYLIGGGCLLIAVRVYLGGEDVDYD